MGKNMIFSLLNCVPSARIKGGREGEEVENFELSQMRWGKCLCFLKGRKGNNKIF
jgi:hypothetical protein